MIIVLCLKGPRVSSVCGNYPLGRDRVVPSIQHCVLSWPESDRPAQHSDSCGRRSLSHAGTFKIGLKFPINESLVEK